MFVNCWKLKINSSKFAKFPNCNSVNIGGMFQGCGRDVVLEEGEEYNIDLSEIFTYSGEEGISATSSLGSVFAQCGATKIKLPNNFTVPNFADGRSTFRQCPNLKYIDLNGATFKHRDFRGTFADNPQLETIDFTGVKLIAIQYLSSAFSNNPKLKNIIVGEGECVDLTDVYDTSDPTVPQQLFQNCPSLTDLSMFKMSANYNRWQGTFNGCSSLTKLPIFIDLKTGTETKHLTSANYGFESTFRLCSSLIDLSEYTFEMINPYSNGMGDCFSGCQSLIHIGRLICKGKFDGIFYNCKELTTVDELQLYRPTETVNEDGTISQNMIIWSSNAYFGASKLTNTTFTGASQCSYQNNTQWQVPPFSRESILSLFNILSPARAINGLTNTITINRNSYRLLSSADIAIATDKGWSIVQSAN